MKLDRNKLGNFLLGLIFIFLLVQKAPLIYQNFTTEGSEILTLKLQSLSLQNIEPVPYKPLVLVFWATWCGPCQVELARVNSFVNHHPEFKEQIWAVSSNEEAALVTQTAQERGYTFSIALDPRAELAKKFNISGTPTIVFIDKDKKVTWVSTGLSPTLELRLKNFLTN